MRALGSSNIRIGPLGLGCAALGELFSRVSEKNAHSVLDTAWLRGVRYFDTAPLYGHGLSEHRLCSFFFTKPRSDFVVSTKVGRLLSAPVNFARRKRDDWIGGFEFESRFDYSFDAILRSYEDSQQRLGLARIDILLIHELDLSTHGNHETVEHHFRVLESNGFRALSDLRRSGAVGAIGAGLNDRGMVRRFLKAFDLDVILLALDYTLLNHPALHRDLPACAERGVSVIAAGVFNSGIGASGAVPGALFNYAPATPEILARVRAIEAICARHGVSLSAASLQFPLGHKSVACVLPGADSAQQVMRNLADFGRFIPQAFWSELKSAGLVNTTAPSPASRTVSNG